MTLNPSSPRTIYLTVDIDWSHDDVVSYVLDFFEEWGVPLTVFLTHETALIDRLRKCPLFEMGVHPNFNDILKGEASGFGESMESRIAALQSILPVATSIRSHALVHGTPYLDLVARLGFRHESNTLIPISSGLQLGAWRHPGTRLIRVPYLFDDSMADREPNAWDPVRVLNMAGLRVLNFHPGRLFLNWSETDMSAVQDYRQDPIKYVQYRRADTLPGSMTFVRGLIERHHTRGGNFGKICEITDTPR